VVYLLPLKDLNIGRNQGCEIFLVVTYQNGKYIPKHHIYTYMEVKYTKMDLKVPKWPLYTPKFSILRPAQINQNCDFWSENMPSGNPGRKP
jgi:hypothetical protein